jgi:hypothetical protein
LSAVAIFSTFVTSTQGKRNSVTRYTQEGDSTWVFNLGLSTHVCFFRYMQRKREKEKVKTIPEE